MILAGATWHYDRNMKNRVVGYKKFSYKHDPALAGFPALTAGLTKDVFDVCDNIEG